MPEAFRLDTDMSTWCPITRHYRVDGGYLAVTAARFANSEGTRVFLAAENGGALSLTPLAEYEDGTGHTAALEALGYVVTDELGDEPVPPPLTGEAATADVVDMVRAVGIEDLLPPQIAAVISAQEPAR